MIGFDRSEPYCDVELFIEFVALVPFGELFHPLVYGGSQVGHTGSGRRGRTLDANDHFGRQAFCLTFL